MKNLNQTSQKLKISICFHWKFSILRLIEKCVLVRECITVSVVIFDSWGGWGETSPLTNTNLFKVEDMFLGEWIGCMIYWLTNLIFQPGKRKKEICFIKRRNKSGQKYRSYLFSFLISFNFVFCESSQWSLHWIENKYFYPLEIRLQVWKSKM